MAALMMNAKTRPCMSGVMTACSVAPNEHVDDRQQQAHCCIGDDGGPEHIG